MDEILKRLARGELSVEEASRALKADRLKRLQEFARIDLERAQRTGIPELILALGKSSAEVAAIALAQATAAGFALITRARDADLAELRSRLAAEAPGFELEYNPIARTILLKRPGYTFPRRGKIGGTHCGYRGPAGRGGGAGGGRGLRLRGDYRV